MNSKQQALLNKAKKAVRFAEMELREGGPEYAAAKAYFAMFYIAQAFLMGKGLAFKKHSAVASAFGQNFSATGVVPSEFHGYLLDAQEARHIGDYLTDDLVSDEDATEHIQHAKQFIALAEKMLGSVSDEG